MHGVLGGMFHTRKDQAVGRKVRVLDSDERENPLCLTPREHFTLNYGSRRETIHELAHETPLPCAAICLPFETFHRICRPLKCGVTRRDIVRFFLASDYATPAAATQAECASPQGSRFNGREAQWAGSVDPHLSAAQVLAP